MPPELGTTNTTYYPPHDGNFDELWPYIPHYGLVNTTEESYFTSPNFPRHILVFPARRPVPGENPSWDRMTGRVTTQPSRVRTRHPASGTSTQITSSRTKRPAHPAKLDNLAQNTSVCPDQQDEDQGVEDQLQPLPGAVREEANAIGNVSLIPEDRFIDPQLLLLIPGSSDLRCSRVEPANIAVWTAVKEIEQRDLIVNTAESHPSQEVDLDQLRAREETFEDLVDWSVLGNGEGVKDLKQEEQKETHL